MGINYRGEKPEEQPEKRDKRKPPPGYYAARVAQGQEVIEAWDDMIVEYGNLSPEEFAKRQDEFVADFALARIAFTSAIADIKRIADNEQN